MPGGVVLLSAGPQTRVQHACHDACRRDEGGELQPGQGRKLLRDRAAGDQCGGAGDCEPRELGGVLRAAHHGRRHPRADR
eukprot:scaffold813_cov259-Pinguiococcus_pyrenoidosus.AAC.2